VTLNITSFAQLSVIMLDVLMLAVVAPYSCTKSFRTVETRKKLLLVIAKVLGSCQFCITL